MGVSRLCFAVGLAFGLVWAAMPSAVVAQEGVESKPTAAEFKDRVKHLDQTNPKLERLEAIKWLCRHAEAKDAHLAISALEQCIRKDPEAKVRENAIEALGLITKERQEPCPLVIVEALLDKDIYVSQMANALAGLFTKYAPGSVEILLRCARSERATLREYSVSLLALAAGKDKRVLEAIRKATHDENFGVRHNAHCALFQANGNLEEFLAYFARLQDDPDGTLGQVDRNSEAGKQELLSRNLALISSAMLIAEWSDKRAEELAPILLKMLASPSPVMRRCAARWIGASATKVDLAISDWKKLFEQPPKHVKPQQPLQQSKVAIHLEKLKIRDRLRQLRDNDPDRTVRDTARWALEQFARVRQKAGL
jgi:hypothetical protein